MSLLALLQCPLCSRLALSGVTLFYAAAALVCRETRRFFVNCLSCLNCWRLLRQLQPKRIRTRSHLVLFSRPKWRMSLRVACVDVSASGQQRAQDARVSAPRCKDEKRYMMPCVFVIRIGAVREKKLDKVKITEVNGNCQGIDLVDSLDMERLVNF